MEDVWGDNAASGADTTQGVKGEGQGTEAERARRVAGGPGAFARHVAAVPLPPQRRERPGRANFPLATPDGPAAGLPRNLVDRPDGRPARGSDVTSGVGRRFRRHFALRLRRDGRFDLPVGHRKDPLRSGHNTGLGIGSGRISRRGLRRRLLGRLAPGHGAGRHWARRAGQGRIGPVTGRAGRLARPPIYRAAPVIRMATHRTSRRSRENGNDA